MDTKDAGRMGGVRRAANMTAEARQESARVAARARWANVPESRKPTKPRRRGTGSKAADKP